METTEKTYGTAISVILEEATGKIIFCIDRKKREGFWRLPGNSIREHDLNPGYPQNIDSGARSAIAVVVKKTIGITIPLQFVMKKPRARMDPLYVFTGLLPRDTQAEAIDSRRILVQSFSLEETHELHDISSAHLQIAEEIVLWIQSR